MADSAPCARAQHYPREYEGYTRDSDQYQTITRKGQFVGRRLKPGDKYAAYTHTDGTVFPVKAGLATERNVTQEFASKKRDKGRVVRPSISLPITAHHCPSLPITAHHCPSLPITAHHCPSLPIAAHLRAGKRKQGALGGMDEGGAEEGGPHRKEHRQDRRGRRRDRSCRR